MAKVADAVCAFGQLRLCNLCAAITKIAAIEIAGVGTNGEKENDWARGEAERR